MLMDYQPTRIWQGRVVRKIMACTANCRMFCARAGSATVDTRRARAFCIAADESINDSRAAPMLVTISSLFQSNSYQLKVLIPTSNGL